MIKLFEQYTEYNQVKEWLDRMGIKNYTINDDSTVDVNDHVSLFSKLLVEIPIQFGNINGCFYCQNNKLTSLKGFPKYVSGDFSCATNKLTSLEGCPEYVGGNFYCHHNKLTSLKGCPKYISKDFYCINNKLTSLKFAPIVDGVIKYYNNQLPDEIEEFTDQNLLLNNQEEYEIWNSDGSFNDKRFNIFLKDQ